MKYSIRYILSALISLSAISANTAKAIEVGKEAPGFSLQSTDGKKVSLDDYKGKVVVLEWFNAGCPFVKKHYDSGNMQKLQGEFTGKDVVWLTINSTSEGNRDFMTPEKANAFIKEKGGKATAMLTDADGKVGKVYGAATTPDMYVIDPKGVLVYHGAIDDKADLSAKVEEAKNYVSAALVEVLANKPVTVAETKPYGCSVKYAS